MTGERIAVKQIDHRALAHYLLDRAGAWRLWQRSRNRRAFVMGCVCPDYLPTTYLRGFGRSHAMRGHNAIYSTAYMQRTLQRLQENGVRGLRDCYTLGSLIHYLADSFTHAHNVAFSGDMRAHRRYEERLHRHMERYLRRSDRAPFVPPTEDPAPLESWYRIRRDYEREGDEYARDCRAIVEACSAIFCALSAKIP